MPAPVVTVDGKEVRVMGSASDRAHPVPPALPEDRDAAGTNGNAATVVFALALVASLLVLLSAIHARNRRRSE